MTTYSKWMMLIIILLLGIVGVVVGTIQDRFFDKDILTIAEASEKVEQLYAGTVESYEKTGDVYVISFERNGAVYDVQVNAGTGNISTLKLVTPAEQQVADSESTIVSEDKPAIEGNKDTTVKPDSTITPTIDTSANSDTNISKPVTPTIISKARAIEIARAQLQGEVDGVIYEKTVDGGYYLVEIDSDNDEAVFQIHAVSGKVMSVTHDDKGDHADD